ncbi:MAG: hypothetical protein N3A58_05895 [Spirochaetes bacterium]|nr:hypothetical protein [Spirochaetota bacterium]
MSFLWAVFIKEFNNLKIINVLVLFFALVTFIFFVISENKDKGLFSFTGLFQRLNLLILYCGLIINFLKLKNK